MTYKNDLLRQPRLAIGVTAMAIILGGGAYSTTKYMTSDADAQANVTILATAPSATSDSPSPQASDMPRSGEPSTTTRNSAMTAPSGEQSIPVEARKSIEEARERMRKDGVEVQRARIPKAPRKADDIEVTTKGSLKEGGIVRILAAREDLTGQRELAYVAGGIQNYRNVPCSQTFQFSTRPKPQKKDNLLMCWRTTPAKSVVAIVVDPQGKPSKAKALAAIERKWRDMP